LQVALGHIERQLELVRNRALELGKHEQELTDTRKRVMRRIREQGADTQPTNLG
jgi:hypothetical protein